MPVNEGAEVSIEYTLKLDSGQVVDSNIENDPLTYTHGEGQILPALEKALDGMETGDSTEVRLTAEEGYGESNPDLVQEVAPDQVPEDARKVGTILVGTDAAGNQRRVQVAEVRDDAILLDLNHPLAGEPLNFEVKIVSVD